MASHFDIIRDSKIPIRQRVIHYARAAGIPIKTAQLEMFGVPHYEYGPEFRKKTWTFKVMGGGECAVLTEILDWCRDTLGHDHFINVPGGLFFTDENSLLMFKLTWHEKVGE